MIATLSGTDGSCDVEGGDPQHLLKDVREGGITHA
jgi:hypothetical protein